MAEMEVDTITSVAVVNPWPIVKHRKRGRRPQDDLYLSNELGMRMFLYYWYMKQQWIMLGIFLLFTWERKKSPENNPVTHVGKLNVLISSQTPLPLHVGCWNPWAENKLQSLVAWFIPFSVWTFYAVIELSYMQWNYGPE